MLRRRSHFPPWHQLAWPAPLFSMPVQCNCPCKSISLSIPPTFFCYAFSMTTAQAHAKLGLTGFIWHILKLLNPCFHIPYCVCMLVCWHYQEHEGVVIITGPQLSPWTVNLMIRAVISSPMHTWSWDGMETNPCRGVGVTTGKEEKKKKKRKSWKQEWRTRKRRLQGCSWVWCSL